MMAMRLKAFREGDSIPDGARFVRTEEREVSRTPYEKVVAPQTLLSWLGITESVEYGTRVRSETVNLYEVPE